MNAKWGLVARMIYKLVRPRLVELAASTDNKADDLLIKVADVAAGIKSE